MQNITKCSRWLLVLFLAMAVVFLVFGSASAGDLPGKGVRVRPVDQGLIEEQFQYEVLIAGLEELGYKVEPILHMSVCSRPRGGGTG